MHFQTPLILLWQDSSMIQFSSTPKAREHLKDKEEKFYVTHHWVPVRNYAFSFLLFNLRENSLESRLRRNEEESENTLDETTDIDAHVSSGCFTKANAYLPVHTYLLMYIDLTRGDE
ncbi:hypothetical protein CSUI_006479 [Cystoisospora suis]|uniref:Uncharacterized protein n=1 Tax=Cystoisospora suis TaxID=483139 RepID=A0A2C6KRL2_9APIC|nr:hypothetical protein CSUI_006479 [Cystoisospora suis]